MDETATRDQARATARAAWADLGSRLATVTPAQLGRIVLTVVVGALIVGGVAATWPALLPFSVGFIVAYTVLPLVNSLDRVLPRALAAAVTMLVAIGVIVGAVVIVVPPLASGIVQFVGLLPTATDIERGLDDVLATLPDDSRQVVQPIIVALTDAIRDGLQGTSGGLRDIAAAGIQAALGVVGAILGLLVLPTWMLTVVSGSGRIRRSVDRGLAPWLRADFWAVVRMLDRAAGAYLRGFVVTAATIGLLVWVGLSLSSSVGGPQFQAALAIAVFAGIVQLIPELGSILGFLPVVLLLAVDTDRALVYLGVYIAAGWLGGNLVGGRVGARGLGVPRIVLVPGVVVLSQLGFLWLLLSAPIFSFGADFVRYVHGRLSEPPRPAGVLPGEPVPAVPAGSAAAGPAPIPSVYRRRADVIAARSAQAQPAPAATAR